MVFVMDYGFNYADGRHIGGHVRRVDGFYDGLCLGATHVSYEV